MVTRVTVCSFGGAFGCFRPPVAPVSGLGSERKCIINGVSSTESLNFPIRQLFQVYYFGSCERFSVKTRAFYSAKMVMHEPDHQLTVVLIVVMRHARGEEDMSDAMLRSTVSATGDVNARFRQVNDDPFI